MPNWCSNNLTVQGDAKRVTLLYNFLKKLIPIQDRTGEGQRHALSKIDQYMFDIYIADDLNKNELTTCFDFSFESRWAPIQKSLIEMAVLHRVNIHCHYDESGCKLMGEFKIEYNEEHQEITYSIKWLTDEDYNECTIRIDDEDYEKNETDYENESENLEHALSEKDFDVELHFHISEYETDIINQL